MKSSIVCLTLLLCFCFVSIVSAQLEFPTPTDEHKWLKKFVGTWEVASKAKMGEDLPAMESTATMKSEMLGEFWLVNTMDGNVGGMTFRGIQTIGFDAKKKKYVGTWVDSVNNYLWHYEGTVDDSGKKIVLEAEGPNMMDPGKMSKYRDAYEFKGDDVMIATSSIQGEDGKWTTFNTGEAKRKASGAR